MDEPITVHSEGRTMRHGGLCFGEGPYMRAAVSYKFLFAPKKKKSRGLMCENANFRRSSLLVIRSSIFCHNNRHINFLKRTITQTALSTIAKTFCGAIGLYSVLSLRDTITEKKNNCKNIYFK
jgi:hypothetical protein